MATSTTKLILHHTVKVHSSDVNGVSFNKYCLATCSADKTVRLLNLTDFSELPPSPLQGHSYAIHCCAFAAHGDLLATCSTDGTCVLWNVISGLKVGTLFHASKTCIRVCAFSPRATRLATGSSDETVCLWDVETRKLIRSFEGHATTVTTCTFSPNGAFVLSGSTGGDIRVWDALYGHGKQLAFQAEAHDLGVTCAAFSPSYTEAESFNDTELLLATGGFDNCVKLWQLCFANSGSALRLQRVLEGHGAPLMSCCFAASGSLLASGGVDKTVRLWDPKTGEQLCMEEQHSRCVTCCAFSEDDRLLATASSDHLVNVWTVVSIGTPTGVPPTNEVGIEDGQAPPVTCWSVSEVSSWLAELGMAQYIEVFRENAIDGTELLALTDEALEKSLKISALGHRNKILRTVQRLTKVMEGQAAHQSSDGTPDEYLCPITREIMRDPVIASDGYSYERTAISAWMDEGKRSSPMTNAPLLKLSLTPNRSLKMLIQRHITGHQ